MIMMKIIIWFIFILHLMILKPNAHIIQMVFVDLVILNFMKMKFLIVNIILTMMMEEQKVIL